MVNEVTIEKVHGNWWFCQRGVYENSSVLHGQDFRQLCQHFDTLPEAVKAHPEATVYDDDNPGPDLHQWELPKEPESWFHPEDAGEAWGEDDY